MAGKSKTPYSLVLRYKSGEKIKGRNRPKKEIVLSVDSNREQRITVERTEDTTEAYHEGKILKNGGWIVHPKHLKSYKKHGGNE